MAPDGLLGMDALVLNYRAKNKFDGVYFDRPVLNFGFSFSFPEKNISGMRWLGKGPYRVWKNRIEGLQQYGDGRILSSAYLSGIQRVSCRSLLGNTPIKDNTDDSLFGN